MDENIYDDNSSDSVVLPEDENPFRNEDLFKLLIFRMPIKKIIIISCSYSL